MGEMEQYHFLKDGKVYLKGFMGMPDRVIGEVVETEEKSVQYFVDRFAKVESVMADLEDRLTSTPNKGSFLMKVVHLQDFISKYNAIGDFESVFDRLKEIENDLRSGVEESRGRNLELKAQIYDELCAVVEKEDWAGDLEEVKEIHQRWIKTGRVAEEEEGSLEVKFKEKIQYFFDKRQEYYERKREVGEMRLAKYQALVDEARTMLRRRQFAEDAPKFKELQKSWKTVGNVSKRDLAPLWKEFRYLGNSFFKGLTQETRQKRDQRSSRGDSVEQKRQALAEMEALMEENNPSPHQFREVQNKWKRAGFVSGELLGNMAERFSKACQIIKEKQFIHKVLSSKHRGFEQLSEAEQNTLRRDLVSQLISRDENELARFQQDGSMVNLVDKGNGARLMNSRLQDHHRKLQAKKAILKGLSAI